jgi:hypothetical protein
MFWNSQMEEEELLKNRLLMRLTLPQHLPSFKDFQRCFKGIKTELKFFQTDDPNFECSMKITSTIKDAYTCYHEISYEKEESSVQTSLDSYFKKPLPLQPTMTPNLPINQPIFPYLTYSTCKKFTF